MHLARQSLHRLVPAFGLVLAAAAHGQTPMVGAGLPPASPSPVATAPAADAGSDAGSDQWKVVTGLATGVSYDDNIFIRRTQRQGDFSFQADPDLAAGWGNFRNEVAQFPQIPHVLAETGEEDLPRHNYLFADYTPDGVVYAKYHHADALNHDVRLEGRDEEALVVLHGQFNFQYESAPNIDLGRRINSTYYTGDAGAEYALSGKMTLGVDAYGNRSQYSGALTTTDSRGSAYADYDILPKTTIGLGGAYGYLMVQQGGNQHYEQPLLRLKYAPGEKLSFDAQAGEEFRQFQSHLPQRTQFVFQVQGHYEPAEGTVLTAAARRQTDGSAEYAGEDMVETVYDLGIRQQVLRRTYLGLNGGFLHVNYVRNDATAAITRRDDYYFGRVSLARDLTSHGALELSYEHRNNSSSLPDFGFAQNVVTLSATWLF